MMHITGMRIHDFPPFTEWAEFTFDKRVNLLVGANATGKSTVLRVLRGLHGLSNDDEIPLDSAGNYNFLVTVSSDWPKAWNPDFGEMMPTWNTLPMAAISSARNSLPQTRDPLSPQDKLSQAEMFDGSMWHLAHGDDLYGCQFDGAQVELIGNLLADEARNMFYQGSPKHYAYTNFKNSIQISFDCARSICSEVIYGSTPHNFIANEWDMNYDLLANPDVRVGMSIDTIDANFLEAHSLSSGTQTVLLWIRWLAFKMLYHYDFEDGWEKQPAILLIDEIENHLHPTWQRRVIPALLEHFPGLQIFATTHSPFVVAGLKAGQVHLLNRDANGVVTASTNTEDIVGWTADEILRTMMGVQDPTDDETARNAAELRQLRDEGPRADEGEEAERQKRMQQLRRLVDRDLLAGGPMARRREEFANRFREAMARRREEELNQDNG